jgi:hypothetical protein
MKNKSKWVTLLLISAALSPALAVGQGMSSNLVLLRVNDAETALDYNANGSSHGTCMSNPGRGCVRVSGSGEITFRLVNDRQCSSGGRWHLTGVQLGGENSGGKGSWGGLSATAAADFGADPGSGWASTSSAPGGGIMLYDGNSEEYSIWYRVQASCEGAADIWFDPRFENDGTGN